MLGILALFLLVCATLYGFGLWYKSTQNQPLVWGTSWSFKYAEELGIDPREGLEAVARELPVSRLRLMTYWDRHEPQQNVYDWSELDYQMDIAKQYDKKVTLAIGLRQPRWPECHMPHWAQDVPREQWLPELKEYMAAVIKRYDSNGVVIEYQLENEFLTDFFGECPDHDRERLIEEYDFVNALTEKPIIVSRSNNFLPSWPIGEPRAEKTALSVYKRVHIPGSDYYFEYPYPAWFYSGLAGLTKATTGVDTFIHELQAEPWGPGATVNLTDEQQAESMDAERLEKRLSYAVATGLRPIDIWGAEWYYWRKTELNDPSTWNVIKESLPKYK